MYNKSKNHGYTDESQELINYTHINTRIATNNPQICNPYFAADELLLDSLTFDDGLCSHVGLYDGDIDGNNDGESEGDSDG